MAQTEYLIVTKEDGIEYILHSNNQFYWNWWYNKGVYPLSYKRLGNAQRRMKKVQSMYRQYKLEIREMKPRELMKQAE